MASKQQVWDLDLGTQVLKPVLLMEPCTASDLGSGPRVQILPLLQMCIETLEWSLFLLNLSLPICKRGVIIPFLQGCWMD